MFYRDSYYVYTMYTHILLQYGSQTLSSVGVISSFSVCVGYNLVRTRRFEKVFRTAQSCTSASRTPTTMKAPCARLTNHGFRIRLRHSALSSKWTVSVQLVKFFMSW